MLVGGMEEKEARPQAESGRGGGNGKGEGWQTKEGGWPKGKRGGRPSRIGVALLNLSNVLLLTAVYGVLINLCCTPIVSTTCNHTVLY